MAHAPAWRGPPNDLSCVVVTMQGKGACPKVLLVSRGIGKGGVHVVGLPIGKRSSWDISRVEVARQVLLNAVGVAPKPDPLCGHVAWEWKERGSVVEGDPGETHPYFFPLPLPESATVYYHYPVWKGDPAQSEKIRANQAGTARWRSSDWPQLSLV